MRTIRLMLLVLLVLPVMGAWAANPVLTAQVQGIKDSRKESADLRLASLEIDIEVAGALADVTLTARFSNTADDTLEGEFSFDLPEAAVVTGYALDIQGRLLDGVLVDPLKAERTYEAKVRQGIDPGVARVSRDNRFSTSIYPILARGSRTIRLKFSAPIHALRGLSFPLVTMSSVDDVKITVRTAALRQAPALTLPNGLKANWQAAGDDHVANVRLGVAPLTGELRIGPVQTLHPALASQHENGERRVHILDAAEHKTSRAATGRRLRVYWDRSLSRRDQSLAAERELLGKFLAQSQPVAIDLVVFNSTGARVQRVAASEIDAALLEVRYRGATSFAVLEKLEVPDAEMCLMFTDGVATIDARPDFEPGCEMFVITSAKDADRGFLQRLAGGIPGAVLQLGTQGEAEILGRLKGSGPRVVQARGQDGRALRFTSLDGGADGWSVITEAPASGDIVLRVAGLGGVAERRYPVVAVHNAHFDAAGALWAADRAARLAADDGGHQAFVELSRKFSVASPGLSFLVLETARDYVEAGIEPPPNYPDEWMQEYRKLVAGNEKQRRNAESARLAIVQEQWKDVKSWWRTRFDPKAPKKNYPSRQNLETTRGPIQDAAAAPADAAAPPPLPAEGYVNAITAEDIGRMPARRVAEGPGTESLEEVVTTGVRTWFRNLFRNDRERINDTRPIEVNLADWSVKRPYIKALNDAAAGGVDGVIATQEAQFGKLPAFYFDVAEWLHRRQQVPDALEMLLSALELPEANEETLSMVAERLLRYGSADRAIWLLERAAERTDYLPQPRRSLALALAKRAEAGDPRARADLQRAVQLLDEVIMTPWEGNYDGIEVVSLMEANALLVRLEALGIHDVPLHESLRALLDVDLRVVIEWNTGATDMDLWVDEPNGERAIYDNPRTNIGGRLSNDMTSGYGPEEYLLRKAARGEYRISVNVYASDVINPNGTTVVTAKLYRNFGRTSQAESTMEIELLPDESGARLIGKFTVQ